MKIATVTLASEAPYGQSAPMQSTRKDKETPKDFENRCWKERLHVDENGIVYIPPTALKNCLAEAAKYLGIQIPGKGKSTYTKHFEAGIIVVDRISLGIKGETVNGTWLFVPSDGIRGSGKRVWKCFPTITKWEATATVHIADETITNDVFEHHLRQAGLFIGMGFFRPRNNGFWGRFSVKKIKWSE